MNNPVLSLTEMSLCSMTPSTSVKQTTFWSNLLLPFLEHVVSDEPAVIIFRVEDRNRRFPLKHSYLCTTPHGDETQRTRLKIHCCENLKCILYLNVKFK
jgi:hypothetical protein